MKPIKALDIIPNATKTVYPKILADRITGREKRKLGDYFGLVNFGVNLTHLAPQSISALFHEHQQQDEFVYLLQGQAVVVVGDDEWNLSAGECIGFPKGSGIAHQIRNDSSETVVFLEIGDRTRGDKVSYPHDDLMAEMNESGEWLFTNKQGEPY